MPPSSTNPAESGDTTRWGFGPGYDNRYGEIQGITAEVLDTYQPPIDSKANASNLGETATMVVGNPEVSAEPFTHEVPASLSKRIAQVSDQVLRLRNLIERRGSIPEKFGATLPRIGKLEVASDIVEPERDNFGLVD